MRFGFHFRTGHEAAGAEILTDFMRRTRALLNRWEKKRGHKTIRDYSATKDPDQ